MILPILPRLYLITPPEWTLDTLRPRLADALSEGHVAAVLLTPPGPNPQGMAYHAALEVLVSLVQDAGAAALILDDLALMHAIKADGVHFNTWENALATKITDLEGKFIVGVGGITSRHAAMEAGESGVDYVFFGSLDQTISQENASSMLTLAAWWSELFEIPAVLLAGESEGALKEALQSGTDFIAVRGLVWDDPRGPRAAVATLKARLVQTQGKD